MYCTHYNISFDVMKPFITSNLNSVFRAISFKLIQNTIIIGLIIVTTQVIQFSILQSTFERITRYTLYLAPDFGNFNSTTVHYKHHT